MIEAADSFLLVMILVVIGGHFKIDGSADLGIVVGYCALYCFLSKNGAMNLYWRKSVKCFYYCVICESKGLIDRVSLNKLSCHR